MRQTLAPDRLTQQAPGALSGPPEAPVLPPRLSELTRDSLREYFDYAWGLYEWLFSGVEASARAFGTRPHPFRNSIAFYYGHTAAFYMQKLHMAGALEESAEPGMDRLLARGVSPPSPQDLPPDGVPPDPGYLRAYRRDVRDRVLRCIDTMTPLSAEGPTPAAWALLMGIEHDLIHLQTSLPLIRQLPLDLVERPAGWRYASAGEEAVAEELEWAALPGGEVVYGRGSGPLETFGWDNELGQRVRELAPFEITRHPVTNRQFLDFVRDGGYQRPELWTSAGAEVWRETMQPRAPTAWIAEGGGSFRYRGVFDELGMPWSWPAELNRHEAIAYANWAGCGLLSEAQFHHAVDYAFGGTDAVRQALERFSCGMRLGSPSPVGQPPESLGTADIDLIGGVARWAREDFQPVAPESFRVDPLYDDFSEPWFGADHGLLLGAAFSACGHMAEVGRMRDFMQNHMDQLAGISLVR